MKKLYQPRDKKFRHVRLYLTELKEIWDLCEKNCDSIEVKADQFQIETFEDFKAIKKPIKNLDIRCHGPYIHLKITPMWCELGILEDEERNLGLFEKIGEILTTSQSKLRFLSGKMTYSGLVIIINLVIFFYKPGIKISLIIIAPLIFSLAFSSYIDLKRQALVFPYEKMGSVFTRKRDEVMIAVVAALAGVAFTLLFQGIWQYFS